jgi:hypothetical protein
MNNFVNIYRRRHFWLTRPTVQLFLSKRIWNLCVNICPRSNFVLTWVMNQNCANERSHVLDSNTNIRAERVQLGTSIFTYLLTYLLHWAQHFFEANRFTASQEVPRNSMEPEGSLSHSQVPATCLYPEPVRSSPYFHIPLLKIHLNIILPSTPGTPQWSLSLRFLHQNPLHASPLPHPSYILRPSN